MSRVIVILRQKNKVQPQSYTLQIYKICLFSKKYLDILYIQKRLVKKSTNLMAIAITSCIIFVSFWC